jgi:small subunit ribosomal protein S18
MLPDFWEISPPLNPIQFYMNTSKNRFSPIKAGEMIDYKNIDLLSKFVTEQGKILPRRVTRLSAKQQRSVTKAIKQARVLGSLPFINKEG